MNTVAVTLENGQRLLDRLLQEGVALAHDCGGALACASCRVVVRAGAEMLGPPSDDELDMLERACVDRPGARLACQATGPGEVVVEVLEKETPGERKVSARSPGTSAPVSLTGRAASFLAAQLARHPAAVAVRLAVEPAGCSGFGYRVDPIEAISDGDSVFQSGGVRIAVDPLSLPYLQGATADLVQEGLARRLRFDNPNARNGCGCGESFSA